jgi:hypothetical protein
LRAGLQVSSADLRRFAQILAPRAWTSSASIGVVCGAPDFAQLLAESTDTADDGKLSKISSGAFAINNVIQAVGLMGILGQNGVGMRNPG